MPGGLLDLFGIDPVANRQRRLMKEESAAERQLRLTIQQLQNSGQLAVQGLQNSGQLAVEGARGKNQIGVQGLQNTGQLDVEKNRGANAVTLENTRSGNTMKEKSAQAEIDKLMEKIKSDSTISQMEKQQILGTLTKYGIMYSPENQKVADQALTDPTLRGALQAVTDENAIAASPEFQKANKAGRIAERLAQGFKNQQMATTTTPPGGITVMPPSGFSIPPKNMEQFNQVIGGGNEQSVEETQQSFTDPKTGEEMSFPGPAKVTTKMLPGRVRPRINPALVNSMPPNLGDTLNPDLLEQIRKTLSQQRYYPLCHTHPNKKLGC